MFSLFQNRGDKEFFKISGTVCEVIFPAASSQVLAEKLFEILFMKHGAVF